MYVSMFTPKGIEIVTHYANALGHMTDRVKSALENLDLNDAQQERIEAALVEGVESALDTLADTEEGCEEARDSMVRDEVLAHVGL